ncbi:MAG: UvrD-helicase domain-containing protein, partial [Clostridiales bacterium]|nr:UvrD-helicase domain-containing protein [Clostridiales bacterium]
MDILEGLNQEQLEAVTTTEGYVRVIAGAGSGKTRALTHRFAYLVNEIGISTSNILCVTFTNKAANEMKKRIRTMIGDYDTGYVNTFHGFCVQVLREDIHTMNYPQSFMVLDSDDQETILKTVYRDGNIDSRSYTFTMAADM